MAQTELAIVIPAYKATFLRETLESIANQTDKRFHLYIGDDCSPHDLKKIVDEFEGRIPLTYHRFDTNLGGVDLVAQWERCIALTRGEPWIWLFSDDDVMGPECVKEFYTGKTQRPKTNMFRFDVTIIDGSDTKRRKVNFPEHINSLDLYLRKVDGKTSCFVVEYIFSRDIYAESGGFVNFDLAWGSDLATWVKFGREKGIRTLKNGTVFWRSSGTNISTDFSETVVDRKANALIEFMKWGEEMFPGNNEVRKVNDNGFIRRLADMSMTMGIRFGNEKIDQYTQLSSERLKFKILHLARVGYKHLRNVLQRKNTRR